MSFPCWCTEFGTGLVFCFRIQDFLNFSCCSWVAYWVRWWFLVVRAFFSSEVGFHSPSVVRFHFAKHWLGCCLSETCLQTGRLLSWKFFFCLISFGFLIIFLFILLTIFILLIILLYFSRFLWFFGLEFKLTAKVCLNLPKVPIFWVYLNLVVFLIDLPIFPVPGLIVRVPHCAFQVFW